MPGGKRPCAGVGPLTSPILLTGAGYLLGEQDAQREEDAQAAQAAAALGLGMLSGVAP
jgi:hypothetical protein